MNEVYLKQLIKGIREKSTAIVFTLGFLVVIISAFNLLLSTLELSSQDSLGKIPEKAAVSESASSEIVAYFVHEGDSSWKIATELLGSGERYLEIEKLNGFNHGQLLDIGQIVFVDVGENPAANLGITANADSADDLGAIVSYTVEVGDSLWSIASENYSDPMIWREIYDLNKSTIGSDPNLIFPSTEIELPNII